MKVRSVLDKYPSALLQGWCFGVLGVAGLSDSLRNGFFIAAGIIIAVLWIAGITEQVRRKSAAE